MDKLCVCWSSELILGGMGWTEARWALVLSPFYPGVTPGRWLQVTRVRQGCGCVSPGVCITSLTFSQLVMKASPAPPDPWAGLGNHQGQ